MSQNHLTDQKLAELNLADSLKSGIAEAGFEYCTPIQAASLPIALQGRDVAGQAQTGTGKTIAFLLAGCNFLLTHPAPAEKKPAHIRALILAPTRELAIQIHCDAKTLLKDTGLKLGLVYGGTGYEEQKILLSTGIDILIGTPGRLIDFYNQNLFGLKFVQTLVIDEADRMFDLGFIKDIRYLLQRMSPPSNRLNLLYSATLSYRVMELAYEHMNDPKEIKIDADNRVADQIEELCYYPSGEEKPRLLINLLNKLKPERALIFANTRHGVDALSKVLTANGFNNAALSGEVPQTKREKLLDGFKRGGYEILVATDVAARGLHIPMVSHVFNFDLPQNADDYIHRIGRTARAGKSGNAISFLCEKYASSIAEIEDSIGHSIPKIDLEEWMLEPVNRPSAGNRLKNTTSARQTTAANNRRKDRDHNSSAAAVSATEIEPDSDPASKLSSNNNETVTDETGTDETGTAQESEYLATSEKLTAIPFTPPKIRYSKKFGELPFVG